MITDILFVLSLLAFFLLVHHRKPIIRAIEDFVRFGCLPRIDAGRVTLKEWDE